MAGRAKVRRAHFSNSRALPTLRPHQPKPRSACDVPGGDRKSESAPIKRNNVTLDQASRGNARAYSVTRVQQECKPEVIDSVKPHNIMRFFLDKAKHLAAIGDIATGIG